MTQVQDEMRGIVAYHQHIRELLVDVFPQYGTGVKHTVQRVTDQDSYPVEPHLVGQIP